MREGLRLATPLNALQRSKRKATHVTHISSAGSSLGSGKAAMHGGAQGSGAPRGNQNALKSGRYTKKAIEERRQLKRLIREADQFLENFKS